MHDFEIDRFRWPDGIPEKVLVKHGLFPEEVEESFFLPGATIKRHPRRRSLRSGRHRYILLSQTERGEHIMVVFAYANRVATIITARPLTMAELLRYGRSE